MCAYIPSLGLCLLPPRRRRRKDDDVYFHSARSRRLSSARLQDPAANVRQHSADRQVLAIYVHHEHLHDSHHRHHHQLELPDAADAPDATLDPSAVPRLAAATDLHEPAASYAPVHVDKRPPIGLVVVIGGRGSRHLPIAFVRLLSSPASSGLRSRQALFPRFATVEL